MARKILPVEAFAIHKKRALALRLHCVRYVDEYMRLTKARHLYSLLSGGVDSHICLFAALEAGYTPTVISFTRNDHESKDFITARETAEAFNLKFQPLYLDPSLEEIKKHTKLVASTILHDIEVNKTTVECTWPIFNVARTIPTNSAFLLGFGGDIIYSSSRVDRKKYLEGYDVFRKHVENYYTSIVDRPSLQITALDRYTTMINKELYVCSPLDDIAMIKIFKTMDPFKEGNKPIQKACSRLAFFDYFSKCKVRLQQSFNLGDSGISEAFEQLIVSDWNINKFKSVRGIYFDVQRGEVGQDRKILSLF